MLHNNERFGQTKTTNSFGTSMKATRVLYLDSPRLVGTLNENDAVDFAALRNSIQSPEKRELMKAQRKEVLQRTGYLAALADAAWARRYNKPLPPLDVKSFDYQEGLVNIHFQTFDYFLWKKDCFVEVETSYGTFFVGVEQDLPTFKATITVPFDALSDEAITHYRKVLSNMGYKAHDVETVSEHPEQEKSA